MTEEQKNAENRKTASLTNREFLTFFFFPVSKTRGGFDNFQLNKDEDERFKRYGFDNKLKEARLARLYGTIFYFSIILIIVGINIIYF